MNNSRKTSQSGNAVQFKRKAMALAVSMALVGLAHANPSGLSVVAGQATIQHLGDVMKITNTPGAILNWQQFNIASGQTTQFIQQSAQSEVFNRVTGGDMSQILGTLQSNGKVFLINPAGIFVGQGAMIDTAGFLASTLATSNTDLLNGHLKFGGDGSAAGALVNQGNIRSHSGGSVVLIAPTIENSGIVHADGEVLLAAGHSVTVVDMNHPTVGLTVIAKEGEAAVNLGQVIGRNVSFFSSLVKNSGVVEATDVSVGKGGVIRFSGKQVEVLSGSRIQADGDHGGGVVHLGGGWQGQDASMQNAQSTLIERGVTVSANALISGNGGEVAVWSDGTANVHSVVQAKAGALAGNGGRVETSGKRVLNVTAAADTSAPNGVSGEWLLDPYNVRVVSSNSELLNQNNGVVSFPGQQGDTQFVPVDQEPEGTDSFLSNETLQLAFNTNSTVRIKTTGGTGGGGAGNISIEAPVLVGVMGASGTGPFASLVLEAQGGISITAPVGLRPAAEQNQYTQFDLTLGYNITKPVLIDAPLFLGGNGGLALAPFSDVLDMNGMPVAVDEAAVTFGSGVNNGVNQLNIARLDILDAITNVPDSFAPLSINSADAVKVAITGANVRFQSVNSQFVPAGSSGPTAPINADFAVGSSSADPTLRGQLSVDSLLNVRTVNVNSGGTFERQFSSSPFQLNTLNVNATNASATVQGEFLIHSLNLSAGEAMLDGSAQTPGFNVKNLSSLAGTTLNVFGFVDYESAELDGQTVVGDAQVGVSNFGFLRGVNTTLNGAVDVVAGDAVFNNLNMGRAAEITVNAGQFLSLGGSLNSTPSAVGTFTAETGASIRLVGASTTPPVSGPTGGNFTEAGLIQTTEIVTPPSPFFQIGAFLDVGGLGGQVDAPVAIVSEGLNNHIYGHTDNSFNPVESLNFTSASFDVKALPGESKGSLFVGESSFSGGQFFQSVPQGPGLLIGGVMNITNADVLLSGSNIELGAQSAINVNSGASLGLHGQFTTADLNRVNFQAGKLGLSGVWDNTAASNQTLADASTPLKSGSVGVLGDLTIVGGVVSDGQTNNRLEVQPQSTLELAGTTLQADVFMGQGSFLLLASRDQAGVPLAAGSPVLDGTTITMDGNSLVLVEAQLVNPPAGTSGPVQAVASLNGNATFESGKQGNHILAGVRVPSSGDAASIPDAMTLNVGPGIRLNVTGNTPSIGPELQFYYSQPGSLTETERPVFTVGTLTPEMVAVAEYQLSSETQTPSTTVLDEFGTQTSYVVDGFPNAAGDGSFTCGVSNVCMKIDVSQAGKFDGMVMSALNSESSELSASGVAFAAGINIADVQFAQSTADEIRFLQGVNQLKASDLLSKLKLVNNATVVFSNQTPESIATDLENAGVLLFNGDFTLSGAVSGSGSIVNSGNLTLSNTGNTLFGNNIENNGTLFNSGLYTFNGLLSGSGSFTNQGLFNLTQPGNVSNAVSNLPNASLVLQGSVGQSYTFTQAVENNGVFQSNGATLTFSQPFVQNAGFSNFAPGTVVNGNTVINSGLFTGFGTFNGNVDVASGRVVPGASPGAMVVNGNLTLSPASVLDIEIQGAGMAGVDYDYLLVNGTAFLDGQLNLIDVSNGGDGGTLPVGGQFDFLQANGIQGGFAAVSTVNPSVAYAFSAPAPVALSTATVLRTTTVSSGMGVSSDPTVSQTLDQAFVPTTTTETLTVGQTPTSTTSNETEPEQASQLASQQTNAGTTVSQQSNDIDLLASPSDRQRPSAVCK